MNEPCGEIRRAFLMPKGGVTLAKKTEKTLCLPRLS